MKFGDLLHLERCVVIDYWGRTSCSFPSQATLCLPLEQQSGNERVTAAFIKDHIVVIDDAAVVTSSGLRGSLEEYVHRSPIRALLIHVLQRRPDLTVHHLPHLKALPRPSESRHSTNDLPSSSPSPQYPGICPVPEVDHRLRVHRPSPPSPCSRRQQTFTSPSPHRPFYCRERLRLSHSQPLRIFLRRLRLQGPIIPNNSHTHFTPGFNTQFRLFPRLWLTCGYYCLYRRS